MFREDPLVLTKLEKFPSVEDAVSNTLDLKEGRVSPMLSGVLQQIEKGEVLAVLGKQLSTSIGEMFGGITVVEISKDERLMEKSREILKNLSKHIGVSMEDIHKYNLALSHSVSKHSLKLVPEKSDCVILKAISVLDQLDKDINTQCMRVREWYGLYFPELSPILPDNLQYVKVLSAILRAQGVDRAGLKDLLEEGVIDAIEKAQESSLGVEIDSSAAVLLATSESVQRMFEHKVKHMEYLRERMVAVAPNVTSLVGEVIGARLIAHAGGVQGLAKKPSSTIQIMGAEKALFKAIKNKGDTPKYGFIFGTSLVGQSRPENKGKVARTLAFKIGLASRCDACGEAPSGKMGEEYRAAVERRVKMLENSKKKGPKEHRKTEKFSFRRVN